MPDIKLDPDLVDNVARGSCVLFFGADQTPATPGSPTRLQLAAALAERYPELVEPGQSLPDAAQQFISRQHGNRHALYRFLHDHVAPAPAWEPTALHRAIVALGFDAVVTAWYDDLTERAFDAAGKRVARVVGGADAAYTGGSEDVILVKLYGDAERVESLVVTRKDMRSMEGNLEQRLEDVRPFVRLRPILFVGWDPGDEGLERLYLAATRALGEHRRRNFIVWPNPQAQHVADWDEENVAVVDAEPLAFLQALGEAVRRRRAGTEVRPQAVRVVGKLPYKALDFFDPTDQDIFCGREVEAPVVYRMALSYPLLTLFGQSGVGKTSLLRAGVLPRLAAEGYDTAYVRMLGDPLLAVRQAVCQALGLPGQERAGKTLLDFLRATVGAGRKLVIILDQCEELFTRSLSHLTRRAFWCELGACLDLRQPEVRFVLCLREDFLPHLDEARRPVGEDGVSPAPDILGHSYRLQRLEVDTARLAIVEPAARANCTVEPLLADILLGRAQMPLAPAGADGGEEDGRTWSLVEVDGAVPPPSLQIVMTRLYLDALAAAGHAPPLQEPDSQRPWQPPPLQLRVAAYRASGGAGRILAGYIDEALARLGSPGYPGDRRLAAALLKALVTTRETKAALTEAELLDELAQAETDFDPAAEHEALRATLAALVNLRLLRTFQMGERPLVELAHDHMAREIATWIDEAAMQAKLARELLRQQVESWQRHKLLIAPEALRLIHDQRQRLRRLSVAELELLVRSSLAAGYEASYWFQRARDGGVAVDDIALDGLTSEDFRTRATAVTALGQLGDAFADATIAMLDDQYPQVRVAAIAALERLQPDGAWRKYLKYECYVPAGEFIMGDDTGDDDEKSAHQVYLDAYYIGKYPVTNAEYARFLADRGRGFEMPASEENRPVVGVSWYDAIDYARWAGMRLLTEAEWEKAASWDVGAAPRSRPRNGLYPWGNRFNKKKCNTDESGINGTTPVDKYAPAGDSPYGVSDMAGNIWEWCSSQYKDYPYRADDGREDLTDYEVPRVLRGGSFYLDAWAARCASRHGDGPDLRVGDLGLRVGWAAVRE
jgi:hypothetical protein